MESHPATVWEALADTLGDRLALVQGPTRWTWTDFEDRAARLAGALADAGVGVGAKVGQLLYNGPEYLETYFAALKLRAVPFNVNYRYTGTEIAHLLDNADADALVFHSSLAGVVAEAVARSRPLKALVEVDDGGTPLPGAVRYEEALAGSAPARRITRSPDDVTMTYTGGTTGMPKGVVAKVGPALDNLFVSVPPLMGHPPIAGPDDAPAFAARVADTPDRMVSLPAPPLMHSTALGIGATTALATGGAIVLLVGRRFDADELWDTAVREHVNAITVVGDPFARPMLAALRSGPERDLSRVRSIASSGAMFSAEIKDGLLALLPQAAIIDLIAATEGVMGMSIATADAPAPTGRFHPAPGVLVLGDDGVPLAPGSAEAGRVALPGGADGYYKDEAKTAATFPTIDGRRYTIPGDYARVEPDGSLTLVGRGSSCINTAGEKVYPEEVEEALKAQPGVEDALVFGVDDERFGQKVAAVLSRAAGADEPVDAILGGVRTTLAAYKLPRSVVVVDEVPRTSVGKADYPTARALFAAGGRPLAAPGAGQ